MARKKDKMIYLLCINFDVGSLNPQRELNKFLTPQKYSLKLPAQILQRPTINKIFFVAYYIILKRRVFNEKVVLCLFYETSKQDGRQYVGVQ